MDPQAAWDRMLTAYAESDYASAQEFAQVLKNWLQAGGFPPTVLGHPEIGPHFESVLALASCTYILGFDLADEAFPLSPIAERGAD